MQTVDTTSTGKLVQALVDYTAGKDIRSRTYGFGMNWANVWKRCFTQILRKGVILERWQHRIYWVAQEPAYKRLLSSYGLYGLAYDSTDMTLFQIYDLHVEAAGYRLVRTQKRSATVAALFSAFQNGVPVPPKDAFLESLQARVAELPRDMHLRLEMD